MWNTAITENWGAAKHSTLDPLTDYFAIGGALRSGNRHKDVFYRSLGAEPLLTLKAMFYFRDVREGQGQRQAFRDQLVDLANSNSEPESI